MGCAGRPINEPISRVDPQAGYRPYLLIPKRQNNDPHTLFLLSFSGGGTRAAAFSYGVLEELRRTNVVVNGQPRRLIDEVDMITGVSGGSFTALSYALYGERLFSEYERRFLTRNVQGALTARALNPLYWSKYVGGSAGRSELAAEYDDESWKWRRELLVDRARLAGATKAQAEASVPRIDLDVLDVSFDAVPDPEERAYFMNLPTSFALTDEAVDRLRVAVLG